MNGTSEKQEQPKNGGEEHLQRGVESEKEDITDAANVTRKIDLATKDLLTWTGQITAESSISEDYIWPDPVKRLLKRLKLSEGVLVGVIGLRGVGKSSAMMFLAYELRKIAKDEDEVFSLKWPGGSIYDAVMKCDEFFEARRRSINSEISRMREQDVRFMRKSTDLREQFRESLLPVGVRKQAERDAAEGLLTTPKWLLIDLPDYPKRDPRRIARDIEIIQRIWNSALLAERNPNIILFIQAETFATEDHFFFGKLLIYRIDPFRPEQLIEHFKKIFPESPFTDDALNYVAKLSRGIFRRFKRFLGLALETWLESGDQTKTIDLEFAKGALTDAEIAREMDLELSQIFKHGRLKEFAVKIIAKLMQVREIQQKQLATEMNMSESALSKMLDKLEDYGYCTRERQPLPGGGTQVIVRSTM